MDPRLEQLLDRTPAWLNSGGPEGDIIVSSRVRLARNLANRRFPHLMEVEQARELCQTTRESVISFFESGLALEPAGLKPAERELLVERSLATRDLLDAPRPTMVFSTLEEDLGLLVNEEDHFRVQAMRPGLALEQAYKGLQPLSVFLGRSFELASHPQYGFLTSCPTNVGTGLRASLLLHLPALARAKIPLQRALQTAQRSYLAVRGVHGEGSRALGHLYQISNQRTLGSDVSQQIQAVAEYGRQVAGYEREVRQALFREEGNRRGLLEDVEKSYRRLQESTELATGQALEALSTLRLAALGGLTDGIGTGLDADLLLRSSFQLQPGHIQGRLGMELGPAERDASRARLLRDSLGIPFEDQGPAAGERRT